MASGYWIARNKMSDLEEDITTVESTGEGLFNKVGSESGREIVTILSLGVGIINKKMLSGRDT